MKGMIAMSEAVYGLLGVFLGSFITGIFVVITSGMANRNRIQLEKLKMYSGAHTEAHKVLFAFANKILYTCYPIAERREEAFSGLIRNEFFQVVLPNYLYYSQSIRVLLNELKSQFDAFVEPDFYDEDTLTTFLDNRIMPIAKQLQEKCFREASMANL